MAKILYIEDDPIQRNLMVQMLGLYGFEVEIAEDGLEGVEKAIAGAPDLILTDSRMPRMSGFKAIETIRNRAETAQTPIIALSARVDQRYEKEVRQAGAEEGRPEKTGTEEGREEEDDAP